MHTHNPADAAILNLLVLALLAAAALMYRHRRRLSTTAFGTAFWMTDRLLRAWGMLGQRGLILGRSLSGKLIRVPDYCHVLLTGGTGSGKGIGLIIPNLLDYAKGSLICFDCKGDLYQATARYRQRLGRVIRLAPFGGGHRWNVLDTIPAGHPLLIERARALGWSLIVSPPGGTFDPHWDARAGQVLNAALVFTLLKLEGAERSLNSVHDIVSDPAMLFTVTGMLRGMGDIPARMGGQVLSLFDTNGLLTKEGAGVVSTLARHLDFLTSPAVAQSLAVSDFDIGELLVPGTTLFVQVPSSQLEACKGLLRCWFSVIVKTLGEEASEWVNEILCICDEASALHDLSALKEILIRGRSSGFRLFLAYQSDAQVRSAFRDEPTLIYDNAATQVYLGATSIECADRLSRMLGSWTMTVESQTETWGGSRPTGGQYGGGTTSWGGSSSYAPQGRPLKFPDELLRLPDDFLLAVQSGLPGAVLARKIRWYEDPAFNPAAPRPRRRINRTWVIFSAGIVVLIGLVVRAKIYGYGYWAPHQPSYRYKAKPTKPKRGDPAPKPAKGLPISRTRE